MISGFLSSKSLNNSSQDKLLFSSTRKKIQNYSYALSDRIGKGFSSVVYKGKNQHTVAIKVIQMTSIKDGVAKQMLQSQIQVLRTLNHPNVLKCFDVYTTINNCYIITQFCKNGDLAALLKKKGKLPQEIVCQLFNNIYKGFKHMVQNKIVHRDLKPANIFLADDGVKIADFGFSKRFQSTSFKEKYNVGSPLYMSPQSLKKNIYSTKNDIWSLGIIIYQLLYGETPWECRSQKQLMDKIIRIPVSFPVGIKVSDDLKDFIKKCLEVDESKRISLQKMQFHPLISRIQGKSGILEQKNLNIKYKNNSLISKEIFNISSKQNAQQYLQNCVLSMQRIPLKRHTTLAEKKLLNNQQKILEKNIIKEYDKTITAQINYCRYLFKFCQLIQQTKYFQQKDQQRLLYLLRQQLHEYISNLKKIETEIKNIFNFEYFHEYLANPGFKRYKLVISQYHKKYIQYYNQNIPIPHNQSKKDLIIRLLANVQSIDGNQKLFQYTLNFIQLQPKNYLQFCKSGISQLIENKFYNLSYQQFKQRIEKIKQK